MKRIRLIVKHKNSEETWEEETNCPDGISAENHAKVVIANFNNTLRLGERSRELVKIIEGINLPPEHDWEKRNLMTIMGIDGMYDIYKCKVCRITGKRFGIGGHISRDSKFQAQKYQFCKIKPKLMKRIKS